MDQYKVDQYKVEEAVLKNRVVGGAQMQNS